MTNDVDLPESWVASTLGESTALVKKKVEPQEVPSLPYLGLEHVESQTMRIIGRGLATDVKSTKTQFSVGDVLYGKLRPYLNKVAQPDFAGICSTDFLVFTESPQLETGYLAHFLNQRWVADQAHHLSSGVELPRVAWGSLSQLPISYPALKTDQRSIIESIESARQLQDSAGTRLLNARNALSRFRRSVLAAACAGDLTQSWRESNSVGMAEEIVFEIAEERRERLGRRARPSTEVAGETDLPDSWCWTSISSLVDIATGATPLRRRADYYNGGIPWVTSGAVNAGYITSAAETITDLAIKETNAKLFPKGTLLVAMYGEGQTRGRVAELGIDAATNQAVAALLFNSQSEVLRPYLKLFLLRNYENIRSQSFGGVQSNLSLGVIRDTPVPLPPLAEQEEIVRRADILLEMGETVGHRVETAFERMDLTSQAVVAKALSGGFSV